MQLPYTLHTLLDYTTLHATLYTICYTWVHSRLYSVHSKRTPPSMPLDNTHSLYPHLDIYNTIASLSSISSSVGLQRHLTYISTEEYI